MCNGSDLGEENIVRRYMSEIYCIESYSEEKIVQEIDSRSKAR